MKNLWLFAFLICLATKVEQAHAIEKQTEALPANIKVETSAVQEPVYKNHKIAVSKQRANPHWMSDEQRMKLQEKDYEPAMTREQLEDAGKRLLKRTGIDKALKHKAGKATAAIVGAAVDNKISYKKTYRDKEDPFKGKTLSLSIKDFNAFDNDAKLEAEYHIKTDADTAWSLRANSTSSKSTLTINYGFKF